MQKDYAEILLKSIDEVVSKRLEGISYDITDTVYIIDNTEAEKGKYKVSDGSATYYAYSSNTTYKIDDVVYMTVPNGDYTQQKIIIGKYVAEDDTPYVFQTPFQTLVDITGNVINDTVINTIGLIANNPEDIKYTLLWSRNLEKEQKVQSGFTRLGIQAQFRSWLAELDCASGDYGLFLRLQCLNKSLNSEQANFKEALEKVKAYNKIITAQSDIYNYLVNTINYTFKQNISSYKTFNEQYVELENYYNSLKYRYYDLQLSSNDMYGNPFGFDSFYQQEKVFDISSLGPITACELYFFEKPGSFKDKKNVLLSYQDEFGNLLIPNLFVKNPYICLGYGLSEFESESISLFTLNTSTYNPKDIDEKNRKFISLRWFHNDNVYYTHSENEPDYEIRWYRYVFGSPSADEYSGVYWRRVNEENLHSYTYNFIPNGKKANELVKAILIQDGVPFISNTLTFTNEQEVVNDATKDFVSGLNIWCVDGTYGNYYIYDPGNRILEQYRTNEAHRLQAMFSAQDGLLERNNSASLLTEAESITWTFNTTYTMITANDLNYHYSYGNDVICGPGDASIRVIKNNNLYTYTLSDGSEIIYDDNEKTVSITRRGDANNGYRINSEQLYFIKDSYSQSNQNNVIQCKIVKNGNEYFTSKRLFFGQAGTSGTDATVRIYFDPADKHALISKPGGDTLTVRAVLFDSQNKEIDFNDETLSKVKVIWKWYVSNSAASIIPSGKYSTGNQNNYNLQINNSYYNSNLRNEVIIQTRNQISMNTYLIIEATIKDWGDYDLVIRRPIPISAQSFTYNNKKCIPQYVDCAEEVIYNATGYPNYYKEPWKLHYKRDNDENGSMDIANGIWSMWFPNSIDRFTAEFSSNILKPLPFYVEDGNKYGAQFKVNNNIVWSQPIYVCQSNYPSTTLNKWDGKSLILDKENGTIISTAIAAGKKVGNNQFSGVIIGDWSGTAHESSISKQTGVYGFHEGAISYAFMEDGTAFIGKSGQGRILFDGEHSTITSQLYDKTSNQGMILDFVQGLIKLRSSNGDIIIDAGTNDYPLKIGNSTPNFYVEWNGTIHATEGNFSGTINASTINSSTINGATITAESAIYIPDSTDPKFSVDSNGYLKAVDGDFSGKITSTEGTIGGFTITKDSLYSTDNDNMLGTGGVYLGAKGTFSLGTKLKYTGSKLIIATNIYRIGSNSDDDEADSYFLIGINNSKPERLQIGSPNTSDYGGGISMYGNGSIYLVADGSDVNWTDSSPSSIYGLQMTQSEFRIYGYPAEQQKGIYARFA